MNKTYLSLIFAVVSLTASTVIHADDQIHATSVEQYKAAIQSFGLDAAQAEQAALAAISMIEEKRLVANRSETINLFASVPANFLDMEY